MKLCTSSDSCSGYQCELPMNHAGRHQGGNFTWTKGSRKRQRENAVFRAYLDGFTEPVEIVEQTSLSRGTVDKHLKSLRARGLIGETNARS